MDRYKQFEIEQHKINKLDSQGKSSNSIEMLRQYQIRNSFGLDPSTQIHRIFQLQYFEKDKNEGYLTLPRATSSIWLDPLENPLSEVYETDTVTGSEIHLGSLVSNFYAMCWTARDSATPEDWASFSHGTKAVRISTTIGKLMDRTMNLNDPDYMHRAWVIKVDYTDPSRILDMMKPDEVYSRMESSGSALAASAAYVRNQFSREDEVRFLFDTGINPQVPGIIRLPNNLIRLPVDWDDFVENVEHSK